MFGNSGGDGFIQTVTPSTITLQNQDLNHFHSQHHLRRAVGSWLLMLGKAAPDLPLPAHLSANSALR